MSFVLDALKRSEQDRHQGKVPNFSEQNGLMHLSKQKGPIWPYVLIGVLTLNAMVFLYIHFSSDEILPAQSAEKGLAPSEQSLEMRAAPKQIKPNSVASAYPASQKADAKVMSGLTERSNTKLQDPRLMSDPENGAYNTQGLSADIKGGLGAGDIDWAAKEAEAKRLIQDSQTSKNEAGNLKPEREEAPEIIRPKKVPAGGALPFPEIAGSASVRASASEAKIDIQPGPAVELDTYKDVPYLYDIQGSARPRVPSLIFNSHIYSDSPSARRVMINNIYLREGQSLSGIEVKRIGETDVVFKKEGTLFRLPAMRDWNG